MGLFYKDKMLSKDEEIKVIEAFEQTNQLQAETILFTINNRYIDICSDWCLLISPSFNSVSNIGEKIIPSLYCETLLNGIGIMS